MNQQQDPGAIEADRREEEARQTGGTAGGDMPAGPGAQGSLGTGTSNDRGNLTGPDSAAGSARGDSQGDDLVNRLGGERTQAGLGSAGAATGDMSAGRSEGDTAGEPFAPEAGSPGGMGGARAQPETGRPPGGASPVPDSADRG